MTRTRTAMVMATAAAATRTNDGDDDSSERPLSMQQPNPQTIDDPQVKSIDRFRSRRTFNQELSCSLFLGYHDLISAKRCTRSNIIILYKNSTTPCVTPNQSRPGKVGWRKGKREIIKAKQSWCIYIRKYCGYHVSGIGSPPLGILLG